MKNITVSLDDGTYHRARIKAAEDGTSVSAAVKKFLAAYAGSDAAFAELKRQEAEIRAGISGFSASENAARDDLHRRAGRVSFSIPTS